jgi:hypothetical protein
MLDHRQVQVSYFLRRASALPNIENMHILVMLNDFGLLLAYFGYKIVYVWNLKGYLHITNRCALWTFANGAENLVLQALKFNSLNLPNYNLSARTVRKHRSSVLPSLPA